jgi:hypothetical protein
MTRGFIAIAFALLIGVGGCHRHADEIQSRPLATTGARFVGTLSDVHQSMLLLEEEGALSGARRGEIWIGPSTEILSRTGMLVPWENLRRGMRVRVWFNGDFSETSTTVQGRASRIIVDF